MNLGFHGDTVDYYQRYRRGYPPEAITAIATTFSLSHNDIAIDLGCGTGQITRPLTEHAGTVIGIDPSPDMLTRARTESPTGITWMIGTDTDIPQLVKVLGDRRVAAVTIGQALHWMNHDTLFDALIPLLRPGGGVAVLTNGTPLWLHDTDWSQALRACVEHWLGHTTTLTCGSTDEEQQRYAAALRAAGYDVGERVVKYTDELTTDQIIGSLYSAMPLPSTDQRPVFEAHIRRALAPYEPIAEHVRVSLLTGQLP
jgi:trans-aconitate methyltransferase